MPLINRSGGGGADLQSGKSATPTTSLKTYYPDTGYDGFSKFTVNAIPSEYKYAKAEQEEKKWQPTTYDQSIPAGTYCSGEQTIMGDADLIASNIKSGVEIFGVTGTYGAVVAFVSSSCLYNGTVLGANDKDCLRFKIPSSNLGVNANKELKAYSIMRFDSTSASANSFISAIWNSNFSLAYSTGIDSRHDQMTSSESAAVSWRYDSSDNSLLIDVAVSDTWEVTTFTGMFAFILCFD